MEQAKEVSNLLGQQLDDGVDDDELMDELEALAAASKPKAKASAGPARVADTGVALPNVPSSPIGGKAPVAAAASKPAPKQAAREEDDEEARALRELEAQLA